MDISPVAEADRAARIWQGAEKGPVRLGSDMHRAMFSQMLLDTFNPYKPAVIDWPALDDEARNRLVSLPIWDIAVQTEGKASLNVRSYAAAVADPLLKQAIELNGFEERLRRSQNNFRYPASTIVLSMRRVDPTHAAMAISARLRMSATSSSVSQRAQIGRR